MVLHFIAKENSGPKPFKHLNFWAKCEGYRDVITKGWSIVIPGYPQYQVVQKLKEVKKALKEWIKTESISTKAKILSIRQDLKRTQDSLQIDSNNIQLQQQEQNLKFNLKTWLAHEEEQIRQKSRENWLALGDKNSSFFHSASKIKQYRNQIRHLLNAKEELIQDMDTIKLLAS